MSKSKPSPNIPTVSIRKAGGPCQLVREPLDTPQNAKQPTSSRITAPGDIAEEADAIRALPASERTSSSRTTPRPIRRKGQKRIRLRQVKTSGRKLLKKKSTPMVTNTSGPLMERLMG